MNTIGAERWYMPKPIRGAKVKHHVSFRLTPELRTEIWEFAESRGYTVASVVEDFLALGMEVFKEREAQERAKNLTGVMG